MKACALFLRATEREWCRSVVVESNHDMALSKWLQKADYREDPANAEFPGLPAGVYAAIRKGEGAFNIFRWALARRDANGLEGIDFVPETGSLVICQPTGGGNAGCTDTWGSTASFTKMAMKMNTGHTHQASILDGVYTAGLSGLMDQGYNKGPGSWSHSHIVAYDTGKRTMVTMLNGRWRA